MENYLKIGMLKFNGKSFFNTLLGFAPYWDYKLPNIYTSEKFLNLSTANKIHLKCDVIDGSVVNGLRQPILFNFVLNEPSGCILFCEPETIQDKKNKQVCFECYYFLFRK